MKKKENKKACLNLECNLGWTWTSQSTDGIETQSSQSSSKVIGTKYSPVSTCIWSLTTDSQRGRISAPLRPEAAFSAVSRWPQEAGGSSFAALSHLCEPRSAATHPDVDTSIPLFPPWPLWWSSVKKTQPTKKSPEQLGLLGVLMVLPTYAPARGLAQHKAAVSLYYSKYTIVSRAGRT